MDGIEPTAYTKNTVQQETSNAKSQFISTVSHELRTPLTSIKGALGLIKSGLLDHSPDQLKQMLNIAYENTERLHKLIDKILDLEKLEAAEMGFKMQSINLSALLEESAVANTSYGNEYGVTFVCSGTEEPFLVNGDYDRLMQVMGNFLSNAVTFSPHGGQVNISIARYDGSLRIAVKDYGNGIPAAALETVFDKFTQANSSGRRKKGGTGLGLNIAKMIIEEHGGHIYCITEIGEGTTFYADLPELVSALKQPPC
jgi:signal transduction histidine kinase